MEFLWIEGVKLPSFPQLQGEVNTDVLIIGGGMAGILCARKLADAGVDCVLLEGGEIGRGVTKGTTAVLSAQHDTLYRDFIKDFGQVKAKQYLDANLSALGQISCLCADIDCDFEVLPSVMYSRSDEGAMKSEAQAVNSLGFPAQFSKSTPLPFSVAGAVLYPNMAQFHPLKFLAGIAKGLNIYEHSFVHRLDGTTAYTRGGAVRANKVIVTTHFPFVNKHGFYYMKLYQKRSFVVAYENAPNLGCTIMDAAENGLYFRNYKDLLIIGGGDRRTGRGCGGYGVVREFAREYFPKAVEKYSWANQDCMSLDGAPYIGSYSAAMPGVFVATGFNEWGMTSSMVAANLLTELLTGRQATYAPVFAPDRSVMSGQLFANLGATAADFVIPTRRRCPHMGAALRYNSEEHTWDCPCHGSRFTEAGGRLDNPAQGDAKV